MNYIVIIFVILVIAFVYLSSENHKYTEKENFGYWKNRNSGDDTTKYVDIYTPLKYSYPLWYNRITPLPFNNPTKLYYYNEYYPYLYSHFYPQSVLY